MKYSLLLSPARQPTPRLEPRHGHINHPTQPWDESKLEINALQGLTAAQRGDVAVGGDSAGTVSAPYQRGKGAAATGTACVGTGCSRVLQKSRVQGRVYNAAPQRAVWGEGTGPPRPARDSRSVAVPAELWAGAAPGGEALSLPGTLIKPCGDARRRHPSLHTQITSYMCFIYCDIFN